MEWGHGVLQSSVLGPLLFLLYRNDLVEKVQGAKPVLIADDTNLLITGKAGFDLLRYAIWYERMTSVVSVHDAVPLHSKQMRAP
jgi:hypothetical protein